MGHWNSFVISLQQGEVARAEMAEVETLAKVSLKVEQ